MQSHTKVIELLVSLWFRRSQMQALQNDANVGTGTLATLFASVTISMHYLVGTALATFNSRLSS